MDRAMTEDRDDMQDEATETTPTPASPASPLDDEDLNTSINKVIDEHKRKLSEMAARLDEKIIEWQAAIAKAEAKKEEVHRELRRFEISEKLINDWDRPGKERKARAARGSRMNDLLSVMDEIKGYTVDALFDRLKDAGKQMPKVQIITTLDRLKESGRVTGNKGDVWRIASGGGREAQPDPLRQSS